MDRMRVWCCCLCLLMMASLVRAEEQDVPNYWLDELVVVAQRNQTFVRRAVASTSVLSREQLDVLPVQSLDEALHYVAGLTFLARDESGAGHLGVVRGFFGGGETDYVLLLIDGVPVNDGLKGLVEWQRIPLSQVSRIEVLHGGGSAMYGDAAQGAVVNVVTRQISKNRFSADVMTGQFGQREVQAQWQIRKKKKTFGVQAQYGKNRGWRSAFHESTSLGAEVGSPIGSDGKVTVSWQSQFLNREFPGPLAAQNINDPRVGNVLFAQDQKEKWHHKLDVMFQSQNETRDVSIRLGGERQDFEETETQLLTPHFGDTQFLNAQVNRIWVQGLYRHVSQGWPFVLGVDGNLSRYESVRFDNAQQRTLFSRGNGHRYKVGVFAELNKDFTDRLRGVWGLRWDAIRDQFEPNSGGEHKNDFQQLTQRVGFNFMYLARPAYQGHVFANFSQAYKVPTLAQLYDQRQIIFDPSAPPIQFSNTSLQPQSSRNVEVGVYQTVQIVPEQIHSEWSASLYRIDVTDEIDFDLQTLKYANISESRHDGAELSATVYFLPGVTVYNTLTWTDVTFRSGTQAGNRLKNIPIWSASSSVGVALGALDVMLTHRYTGSVFLDDDNVSQLPSYSVFDAKIQYHVGQYTVFVNAKNLLNKRHETTGYMVFDPFQNENVLFVYPGAGRQVAVGVKFEL